jgi:hypothetical protein
MASFDDLSVFSTTQLEDELVLTRIMVESLDPEAFDYGELMEQHMSKIARIESLLGIEEDIDEGGLFGAQSQANSQESWAGVHTPMEQHYGLEDMLSPIAGLDAINGNDNDEARASGE